MPNVKSVKPKVTKPAKAEKPAKAVKPKKAASAPQEAAGGSQHFRATLEAHGKTATGFEVPSAVVEALGGGKKPAVQVTIGKYTYRNSIGSMGGRSLIGVSAEHRAAAGVAAGDELDVTLALDTAPREVVVPADFAAALAPHATAKAFFEGLSYSQRRWFVLGIEDAKTAETRARRIEKAVERLKSGRGQL